MDIETELDQIKIKVLPETIKNTGFKIHNACHAYPNDLLKFNYINRVFGLRPKHLKLLYNDTNNKENKRDEYYVAPDSSLFWYSCFIISCVCSGLFP